MASESSASIHGRTKHKSEQRIVLIGGKELNDNGEINEKILIGNLILGKDFFEMGRRSPRSVMTQQWVHGRKLTVVDTPSWVWSHPLALTPQLDQLEIQQNLYLCPPGPHAFLLVIPISYSFDEIDKAALEEHMKFLFRDQAWRHMILVFSADAQFSKKAFQNFIREQPAIRWLVQSCEDRYHVLHVKNKDDADQVTELLEKIDKMVAVNRGCHYETEKGGFRDLKEKMRTLKEREEQRTSQVVSQRSRLQALIGDPNHQTNLRIVMLGGHFSGKSTAGNIILKDDIFEVGDKRTVFCETRHDATGRRHVTVVDSPGWFLNKSLRNTSVMDKLEIQRSVSLCPPGPHAVLLVVPLTTAFTSGHKAAMEEHMRLFTDKVWNHTILLFTHGDWLGDTTIEKHIECEGEDLQRLVEKCGNRYHVFNKKDLSNDTQVTDMLDKIEEMLAGNGGHHFEIDRTVSKTLEETSLEVERKAGIAMLKAHRKNKTLSVLYEGEILQKAELRMLLLGKSQTGRSTAGNMILCHNVFDCTLPREFNIPSRPPQCVKRRGQVAGRNLTVVDSSDWETTQSKEDILYGLSQCSPGPHAFLLVVPVTDSFSKTDRSDVEENMKVLGEKVWRHTTVLFTWGNWLGGRAIEEYIEYEGEDLKWLVEKCGHRYHVLDCTHFNIFQATDLVKKIEGMTRRNRGHFSLGDQRTEISELPSLLTQEEWERREEELIERVLKAVWTEPEESTLPAIRRRNSVEHVPPSMSGGTPSGAGSSYWGCGSRAKVYYWLKKGHVGAGALSSGYGTCSVATSSGYHYMSAGTSSSGYVPFDGTVHINPYEINQTEEPVYETQIFRGNPPVTSSSGCVPFDGTVHINAYEIIQTEENFYENQIVRGNPPED